MSCIRLFKAGIPCHTGGILTEKPAKRSVQISTGLFTTHAPHPTAESCDGFLAPLSSAASKERPDLPIPADHSLTSQVEYGNAMHHLRTADCGFRNRHRRASGRGHGDTCCFSGDFSSSMRDIRQGIRGRARCVPIIFGCISAIPQQTNVLRALTRPLELALKLAGEGQTTTYTPLTTRNTIHGKM